MVDMYFKLDTNAAFEDNEVEEISELEQFIDQVDMVMTTSPGDILGEPTFLPATPYGIIQLLERSHIETSGKHCVVLGRSNIVGTPISVMLSRKAKPGNCTVTLCHTGTKNLKEIAKTADLLIAAMGQPYFVTADMVKEGAVVIDVGIHRIKDTSEKGYHMLVMLNLMR